MVVPHTPDGQPIPEDGIKMLYPKTYEYFLRFKGILEKRTIKPFLSKNRKRKPFYMLDNMGDRVFAPYKVGWKHISGAISGKAQLDVFVMPNIEGKPIVPTHGIMYIPASSEDEAHYIASILNSTIARFIVASYGLEVHITTDVPKRVYIPTFDPSNNLHLELANLSREAHGLAREKYELLDNIKSLKKSLKGTKGEERKRISKKIKELEERLAGVEESLREVEEEIDGRVADLYGITGEELEEIERLYDVLIGG